MKIKRLTESPVFGFAGFQNSGATGTVTSPVILNADPTLPLQAATKRYIDTGVTVIPATKVDSGTLALERFPVFTGEVDKADGDSSIALVPTGVSADTYTKFTVDAKGRMTDGETLVHSDIPDLSWSKIIGEPTTLSGYGITDAFSKTGGTLTGFLNLTNAPTANLEAANKAYADSTVAAKPAYLPGDYVIRPNTTTPTGFLRANGGQISKTTYSALYAVLGDTYSFNLQPGNGNPASKQYETNTGVNSDITGWTSGTSLPVGLTYTQYIITKNRIYSLGGWTSSVSGTSTMYTAPIDSSGVIGTWTTASGFIGASIANAAVVVVKNYVYLIGGVDSNGNQASFVQRCPINTDGTLGTWGSSTNLPATYSDGSAFITKDRIYLVGGRVNGSSSTVTYTAPINSNGTLGSWTTGPALPVALNSCDTIVTKSRVYVLGGNSANIYVSTIASDGTLGTWSLHGASPVNAYGGTVLTTRNRVYLIGGDGGAGGISAIYHASINADGTLGTWSVGTSYPISVGDVGIVATSGYIYVLGGRNASPIATVYRAAFKGGANDYSAYYNGTVTATDPNNFRLPDFTSSEKNGLLHFIKT